MWVLLQKSVPQQVSVLFLKMRLKSEITTHLKFVNLAFKIIPSNATIYVLYGSPWVPHCGP